MYGAYQWCCYGMNSLKQESGCWPLDLIQLVGITDTTGGPDGCTISLSCDLVRLNIGIFFKLKGRVSQILSKEDIIHSSSYPFLYARLKNGRIMPWQCPSVRSSVRVFWTFLQHALRYQFETWYIHSVGDMTCQVWVSSQLGHFDLVYSQK